MINPMALSGKTILVTGASSGIGRAVSILVSRLGASVILVGRDSERLNKTLAMMEGPDHAIQPFDLTQLDRIPEWMKAVTSTSGQLNGFVHCAGIERTRAVRYETVATVEETMKINVYSMIFLAKQFV